jgi:uncharacterized membrane protein
MPSWRPSLPPLSVRFPFLLAGIFIAALILRLYGLGSQNLWSDEFWTVNVAKIPIEDLANRLPEEESKPPLYFVLMHYWMKVGAGEFWLRLPSAICGAIECVVVALLGRQIFDRRVGALLGWLLVFAPFHIHYSQEGRPYALWSLLVSVTLLFLLRYCTTRRPRELGGYVSFAVLASYTFPYAIFVIGLSTLMAVLYRPALSAASRRWLMLANGLLFLLFIPWIWTIANATVVGVQPVHRGPTYAAAAYALSSLGFGMSAGPSLQKLRVSGLNIFQDAPASSALLVFAFLLLLALLTYGSLLLWKRNRNAFWFCVLGILTFWGAAALLNIINPDIPLNPRYAFPALVPILVAVTAVCSDGFRQRGWRLVLPVLFVALTAVSLVNHHFVPEYAREDIRGAARFIDRLDPPVECVFVSPRFVAGLFDHYTQSDKAAEPIETGRIAAADAYRPIADRLGSARRFALVYARPEYGDPSGVLPGAIKMNARLVERRHWTGVDVFVFELDR